jgi:hypothetical protein
MKYKPFDDDDWEIDTFWGKPQNTSGEFHICETAATPMQRSDKSFDWWHYCRKCGDWIRAADVPANKKEAK